MHSASYRLPYLFYHGFEISHSHSVEQWQDEGSLAEVLCRLQGTFVVPESFTIEWLQVDWLIHDARAYASFCQSLSESISVDWGVFGESDDVAVV